MNWLCNINNWVCVVPYRVRTLNGIYFFKPLDPKNITNRRKKLVKHMNELPSKEERILASVKEIPKTALVLEEEHNITYNLKTDCNLPESKRVIYNKSYLQQSPQVPKPVSKK